MDKLGKKTLVINARFLTQQVTGVQRFAIEISKVLMNEFDSVIFVSPKNIKNKEIAEQLKVQTFGKFTSHIWEQIELPAFLKKIKNPLLLNLCNTAPLLFNRNIVCLHDLAFAIEPLWFSKSFRTLYNFLIPKLVHKSLKVLTVSEFSKKSIISTYKIAPEKIIVVYNAVTDIFKVKENKGKYYNNNFVLTVGSLDPRKNLVRLVLAYKKLNRKNLDLIIVGSSSKVFANDELKILINNTAGVKLTGFVDDKELVKLYQEACVFVYPSLFEGFGIPPLEAMKVGCPTVVSNTTSLPEICGNASLYVNPLDVEDIKSKIEQILDNDFLRNDLKQKGIQQAQKFNWKNSAKIIYNVINSIK